MTEKTTCPNCKKQYVPVLAELPDFSERVTKWKAGALIQHVWPDTEGYTSEQREQLMIGLCSDKCWGEYLGVPVE